MKQIKTILSALTIAAALTMTTISCSSDDTLTATPEQPQVTNNGVQVTVGVSLADDATTRSEVEESTDANGKKHTLKFTSYDQLYVFGEIDGETRVAGLLDMKNGTLSPDGKSAKFTGTIKAYNYSGTEKAYNFGGSDPLALCAQTAATGTVVQEGHTMGAVTISMGYPVQIDYSNMVAANVNTLMAEELYVHGAYVSLTKSFALNCNAPIINCTISGLTASKYYRVYLKKDGSGSDGVLFQSDANGVGAFAFGTRHTGSGAYSIVITDNNTSATIGTIELGTKDLTAKVYNVTRNFVNLANINANYTAQDGDVFIGELEHNYKISIANNATVTLSGANINGNGTLTTAGCAGITCLGNAQIILADGTTNYAKALANASQSQDYSGIFVPAGSTLTITGKGTLNASCNTGAYAAGIGGYKNTSCGNIIIQDGIINATGGSSSAGIGGSAGISESTAVACGDITISGGTINATGGSYAPGIGSGCGSSKAATCGDITITTGVTSVTATKSGNPCPYSIGKGSYATCGTIKIGGTTYYDGSAFLNGGDSYLATSPFTYQP